MDWSGGASRSGTASGVYPSERRGLRCGGGKTKRTFGASSPRARRHDPAQEVFAPGCWTWSCSPLPPSLDSIHTDQSVGLPAAWSRLLVLAGWSLTGCEREEGRRIDGGTEESPSPAATEMGGEGEGGREKWDGVQGAGGGERERRRWWVGQDKRGGARSELCCAAGSVPRVPLTG